MRTKVTAGAVAAVVVAGGLAVYLSRSGSTPTAAPLRTPTPSAMPTVTATPEPSPVAHQLPKQPSLPHQYVAPAPPTSFEIKGAAFDITANVCQMANVRPLDPPGDQLHTVCWVKQGFGVAPGSESHGTSYILGHAWSKQKLEVLNRLSIYAMSQYTGAHPTVVSGVPTFPITNMNGYQIILRTANGVLTYQVTKAYAVPKEQAAFVDPLMANLPDRVVIITCGVKNGIDVDVNIIVDAYLISSKKA